MNAFVFLRSLNQDVQLWKSILPGAGEYAIAYAPDRADLTAIQTPEYFSAASDEEAVEAGKKRAVQVGWVTQAELNG